MYMIFLKILICLIKTKRLIMDYNLRALYHLNLLLQKTYLVFRQDISDALAAKNTTI